MVLESIDIRFIAESIVVVIFSFDFLLRLIAHTSSLTRFFRFCRSVMTFVDIFSIFPYYIDLIFHARTGIELQRFSILRLVRMLRLAKCLKYSNSLQTWVELIIDAIKKSRSALFAWSFFFVLIIVTFSSLIFYAERGTYDAAADIFRDINGHPSKFYSIPATFWFVAEVCTTVGFGDIVPLTLLGKLATIPLMMCGILVNFSLSSSS